MSLNTLFLFFLLLLLLLLGTKRRSKGVFGLASDPPDTTEMTFIC